MQLRKYTSFLFIILIGLVISCSSSQSVSTDNGTEVTSPTDEENNQIENENSSNNLISSLSDTYTTNEIPANFSEIKIKVEQEFDLTKGYRIQIYSGQDVFTADTVASTFRAWSDTTIVGYQAETYTFFKTPYYRVHVGDFHNRDRALSFSKMVKRLFKDAWLVHDTVEPFRVPEDTTKIEFQDL